MDVPDLNLDGLGAAVVSIDLTPGRAAMVVAPTAETADCPLCGRPSGRLHGRCTRTLADLPRHGRAVALTLRARRFRCDNPECRRSIFCERLPGLAAPHARSTGRLARPHLALGLALGGEPGARLAEPIGVPAGLDTLLRRAGGVAGESPPDARYIGIDDWARRRGRSYGTIVVDPERRRAIDLLPDREVEIVKRWLADRPGIDLVSRDRASAYSRAASEAAPQARQVADRWHLLKNFREAVERLLEREHAVIAAAFVSTPRPEPGTSAGPGTAEDSGGPTAPESPPGAPPTMHRRQSLSARRGRRVERFERVGELRRGGHSARRIAEEVRMSPTTVRRYLRLGSCPDWAPGAGGAVAAGPAQGLDRPANRRGLHQLGPAAGGADRPRVPDVVGRDATLCGQADRGGRGGPGPVERGPTPDTAPTLAEAALLRLGQATGGPRGRGDGQGRGDPGRPPRPGGGSGPGRRVRRVDPQAVAGDARRLADVGRGVAVSGAAPLRRGHPPRRGGGPGPAAAGSRSPRAAS